MHTSEAFSISFFIKKYKAQDNKAPIYVRITVNGQRTDLSTKLNVDMDNWNPSKGLARGSKEDVNKSIPIWSKFELSLVFRQARFVRGN